MANEVEFNSLTKDEVKIRFEEPSRVPPKPTDEEVQKYRKTRIILVVLFAIVVIAMVAAAVIIIVLSPACEKKEEKGETGKEAEKQFDDSWWKSAIYYQIYPRSFKDSDGDGNGDLKGIIAKLDYLKDLGVTVLYLNPINTENYTAVDSMLGSVEDFDNLVAEAHKRGMKIILGFVPNHTSVKHPWFKESSRDKSNTKRDWYIWQDPTPGVNGTKLPPNNWASVLGGSAWTFESATNQSYLHQFSEAEPDLNLRNPEVVKALKDSLKFWLDKGVDGFSVEAAQYLLEDDKFEDEATNSNYNASLELKYDMLDHSKTYDFSGNVDIVRQFFNVTTGYEAVNSSRILIAGIHGNSMAYYNVTTFLRNFGLIHQLNRPGMSLSQNINATVNEYLAAVPKDYVSNWVSGNAHESRVGSRMGKDYRDAMNVLMLTLPGVASTYYGEEIGMLDGSIPNPQDPRHKVRTPMQWDKEKNAGFTTGSPWLPVSSDFLTLNVEAGRGDNASVYNMYKSARMLRSKDAFLGADFQVVHVDRQVFAYTRGSDPDADMYVIVINFSETVWDGDLDGLDGVVGTVVYDSEDKAVGNDKQDVNKIKLNPGQVFIVKVNN